jgi:glutamine synthetase
MAKTDSAASIDLKDTETGPRVYETTDARQMGDNAVLFKLLAKSVRIKYGIMPCT